MSEHAKKISALRQSLLALHKALLDAQRIAYERKHGRVRTSAELFRLVTESEAFRWLRALSELIVEFDQRLDSPEYVNKIDVRSLFGQTRILFKRTRVKSAFGGKFFGMIEASPHVVMAYGDVSQVLKTEAASQ